MFAVGARFGRYSLTELREAFDDPKERDSMNGSRATSQANPKDSPTRSTASERSRARPRREVEDFPRQEVV